MTAKKDAAAPREKISVEVPAELAERIRDAVFHSRTTLAGFATGALEAGIERAERRYGGRFPRRGGRALRVGRPMKVPAAAARS